MKHLLFILCAVVLSGCIDGPESNNPNCDAIYEYTNDQYSDTGMMLKAGTGMRVTFEQMEQFYKETEQCVGLSSPGPDVWYTDMAHLGLGHPWGATLYATQTVIINTNEEFLHRNCISDKQTLKHEYIHHILYMNGQNPAHGHPAFEKCGLGVKTCNGVPCE